MKKNYCFMFLVALCFTATTAYAQLTDGSEYRIFCAANPAQSVYGTNPFSWDGAQNNVYYTANSQGTYWQFETTNATFIKTSGGGTAACDVIGTNETTTHWKFTADGEPVGGVQYYILENVGRTGRHMYFNPGTNLLCTYEVAFASIPTDATRDYYRIGFEKNVSSPTLALSNTTLAFSYGFLSKDITVTGDNISSDITFTVPAGITLSGTNVVDNAGSYSIAAADATGVNTVTITAASDTGIDGTLTVSSTGATSRSIVLKSGVKQGAWYNIKLFHNDLHLYIDADDVTATQPAVQELNEGEPDQVFTFIPVAGKDETFNLLNASGNYLVGNADGATIYQSAFVGDATEEWAFDLRNGSSVLDYFTEFTLKVGSRSIANYLALSASSAAGVSLVCNLYQTDPRGTFILKEAKAVIINYVDGGGNVLKAPRVQLAGLTVDNTYTALAADKDNIIFGTDTYVYDASSTDNVIVGAGNAFITLKFGKTVGISDADNAADNVVYVNENRQLVIAVPDCESRSVTATVYNVMGQETASLFLNASNNYIDMPQAGIYVVSINENGISKTYKVVVK